MARPARQLPNPAVRLRHVIDTHAVGGKEDSGVVLGGTSGRVCKWN